MDIHQEVLQKLYKIFDQDDQIEFVDERGDQRHFFLKIVSDRFHSISRLQRRRLIYGALDDLITQDHIHALRMQLQTPEENNQKS